MSELKCSECRFFANGQIMGSCRRFPVQQNKHQNDWCGEHQPKMISLPVYDIMTDETKMAEVPAAIAKSKPGRKPKSAETPT
jgi:hypothetical protein